MDEVQKGQVEVYTSVLSIAEVSFAKSEKDGRTLDASIEKKINNLWATGAPFKLVEVHRSITLDAQKLVRSAMSANLTLKPPDAIHLATAKRVGVTEFQTYDSFRGKAQGVSGLVGIPISEPHVSGKIIWPSMTTPSSAKPDSKKAPKKKVTKRTSKKKAKHSVKSRKKK